MRHEMIQWHGATTICQYKNHPVKSSKVYHYWDDDHGLPPRGVKICYACYAKHILEYYPESKIAEHIKNNPDFYVAEVINAE